MRAQRPQAVRADIATATLMALGSGLLLALHTTGNHGAAAPQRALSVLRDGLRTTA